MDAAPGPHEIATQAEAVRLVDQLLEALDDEKREVFVLAELEQMTAPEIAAALAIPVNTVYSRLRMAREEFASRRGAASRARRTEDAMSDLTPDDRALLDLARGRARSGERRS